MKETIKNIIGIKYSKKISLFLRWLKSFTVTISPTQRQKLKEIEKNFPRVMSTSETLELIIEKKMSLCRFGDGEFDICQRINEHDPLQKPMIDLTIRLEEIILSKNSNVIICIPPFNSNKNNIFYYYGNLSFWETYWLKRYDSLANLLKKDTYGNSFTTRESVFFENNLPKIMDIWNNKYVIFVYGKEGRFRRDSILFSNIENYEEILIPPTNAFFEYEAILQECLNVKKSNSIYLIAAGPTATVLAYDLASCGLQAIDIGHLPNSYDEYLGNIESPESIPIQRNEK